MIGEIAGLLISAIDDLAVCTNGEFRLTHRNTVVKYLDRVFARIFVDEKALRHVVAVIASAVIDVDLSVAFVAPLKLPTPPVMQVGRIHGKLARPVLTFVWFSGRDLLSLVEQTPF